MENIAPALLDWFYKNRRILPFREDPTPYHVWLSEVMLQQTRVSAVLPYYERFLAALPDISALAACDEEKLHKLWEGLGYYSRVRNLQKAAKIVCEQYGGQLPADYAALRALPGIGDYTAGAIASISFGIPVPAVDGNVLRVFSRLYNDPGVITDPKVKKAFTARVMEHQPPEKAGDYNQALMELGALVCVPNGAPLCDVCPLAGLCQAHAAGTTAALPQKAKPKPRKVLPVTVALVESPAGFLVQQRPARGCWPGCGSRCCGRANTFCRPKCWQGWQPLEWTPAPQCRKPCRRPSTSSATSNGCCPVWPSRCRSRRPRRAASGPAARSCAPPTPCPVPLPPTRTGCWDDLEILAICPKPFVQNGQEAKKLPATVVIFDRNGYNNHKIAGKRTVPEAP